MSQNGKEKKGHSDGGSVADDESEVEQGCYQMWQEFPKTVFAIFGNEFCERFSYYGMRTVLTLYVVNVLGFADNISEAFFHLFIVVCYTSPLLGSILADGYFGKFKTILWVSLIYASGNVILAIAAIFPVGHPVHPYLDILGLLVIGMGTGGIKPCVSAFGGDQFKKGQERMLEAFFSIFYFSINAGALISTFITPLLRVMGCNGQSTCYPATFGMPAALMVVSVILFVVGSPWYRKKPPAENVIGLVWSTCMTALKNKKAASEKKAYWVEHFLDTHKCEDDPKCDKLHCHQKEFVSDIKAFFKVCTMFLPVPIFWALYDQQGSTWVMQAVLMDGRIGPTFTLLPDQMGTFNSFLILAFIPIFQGVVYPLVRKTGVDPTPLRRMVCGGMLASLSFFIAMLVQFKVQTTVTAPPVTGQFGLTFANTYPNCNVSITPAPGNYLTNTNFTVITNQTSPQVGFQSFTAKNADANGNINLNWIVTGTQAGLPPCSLPGPVQITTVTVSGSSFLSSVGPGAPANTVKAVLKKATTGEGQFKMAVTNTMNNAKSHYMFWCYCSGDFGGKGLTAADACKGITNCKQDKYPPPKGKQMEFFKYFYSTPSGTSEFLELKPGAWQLFTANASDIGNSTVWKNNNAYKFTKTNVGIMIWDQGGIYDMVLSGNSAHMNKTVWVVAPPNTVSILLQVPQYIVITAGEILFSITGLEFSYSQAAWLLTVAGGDLIDAIISLVNVIKDPAWELLLFAILMAVVMVVFMLMSIYWYEYVYYVNDDEELELTEKKSDHDS